MLADGLVGEPSSPLVATHIRSHVWVTAQGLQSNKVLSSEVSPPPQ